MARKTKPVAATTGGEDVCSGRPHSRPQNTTTNALCQAQIAEDILDLLDAHLRERELRAQAERTKTGRAFSAAGKNALYDFQSALLDALAAQGGAL